MRHDAPAPRAGRYGHTDGIRRRAWGKAQGGKHLLPTPVSPASSPTKESKEQAELQVKAFEEIHKDYKPTTSA
jgi:hypothetical protein